MALDWRDTLRTLRTQFEAKASTSGGLYHLLTEVADDERDKMHGPLWFKPFDHPRIVEDKIIYGTWDCSSSGSLPGVSPSFREVEEGEDVGSIADDKLIRDRSGTARAVFVPMKLRTGFYCGPGADGRELFKSLASMAASAIASATDLASHPFASDLKDLFRPPRGGVRYIFGEVTEQPNAFIANGWSAGVLQFEDGVLIDVPVSEGAPSEGHWLLLLHRLGWRRVNGSGVRAERFSWEENSEVDFEYLLKGLWRKDPQFAETIRQHSTESFYSILGNKDTPDDLFLSSAFAINLLLSELTNEDEPSVIDGGDAVDYSREPWSTQKLRPVKSTAKEECPFQPKLGIAVATEIEREAVLKRLLPPRGRRAIPQVFIADNTFYLGRLGSADVVICMCAMGSGSRDASMTVTTEMIDEWNPAGVIMVGIAFGKDPSLQRIGQVLISDRIIPYEPQRVGETESQDRGVQSSASAILLNRFRNVIGWSFRSPIGYQCGHQVGPLLSGEKLIDNADCKRSLFERFPTAIGGEMEASGFAAAAARRRKEWIVAKAICDWGDGTKSKTHQAFAAASAVHLVEHVLNQVGSLDAMGT